MTDSVVLYTNGTCMYNEDVRARDDPRLPAFIALVAPVEVLLVTAAAYPLSPNPRHQAFAGPFRPRRHSRRLSPARCTPTAHAVADGCRSQPNSSRTAKRENAVTRICRFDIPLGLAGRGSSGQPAIALGGARAVRPPRLAAKFLGPELASRGGRNVCSGLDMLFQVVVPDWTRILLKCRTRAQPTPVPCLRTLCVVRRDEEEPH